MHSSRFLRHFLALLLICAAIGVLTGCYDFLNPVDPDADNYQGYPSPAAWSFRRAIRVTNGASELTNYQIAVTLDTAKMGSPYSGLDANGTNLRFRDSTFAALDHWVERWDNTGDSLIWVRMPIIPSGSSVIHLYYGDSEVGTVGDGPATFFFFDDFEDHAAGEYPDQWLPASTFQVVDDSGVMALEDGSADPGQAVWVDHVDVADVAVRQRFRLSTGSTLFPGVLARYTDSVHMIIGGPIDQTSAGIVEDDGGTLNYLLPDWPISPSLGTAYHVQELRMYGTTASLMLDYTDLGSVTTQVSPPTGKTGFWSQDNVDPGYRDWHFVRKYRIPEPTTVIGPQQTP